jgi:hypothetical protein
MFHCWDVYCHWTRTASVDIFRIPAGIVTIWRKVGMTSIPVHLDEMSILCLGTLFVYDKTRNVHEARSRIIVAVEKQ